MKSIKHTIRIRSLNRLAKKIVLFWFFLRCKIDKRNVRFRSSKWGGKNTLKLAWHYYHCNSIQNMMWCAIFSAYSHAMWHFINRVMFCFWHKFHAFAFALLLLGYINLRLVCCLFSSFSLGLSLDINVWHFFFSRRLSLIRLYLIFGTIKA